MAFQISEEKSVQFNNDSEIIWKYIVKIYLLITLFYLKYHKYVIHISKWEIIQITIRKNQNCFIIISKRKRSPKYKSKVSKQYKILYKN